MGDLGVSAGLVAGILLVAGASLVPIPGASGAVVDRGSLSGLDGTGSTATVSPAATAAGGPVDSIDDVDQSLVADHWNLDDDPGYEVDSSDRVHVSQYNGTYRIELVLEDGNGWTMTFDRAVEYGESTGRTIIEAIAGADGRVDTAEVTRAIEYWSDGTPVPGTGGETIETPELLELIDHWAAGTVV